MSKTVLVFDFGASSARAMLCRVRDGGFELEEIHRFPNVPVTENGHLRWDIDELWEQMKIAISFGVFNGGFDAISVDTWGVDFGLIGQDGNLLEKPVHYRDSRTEGMVEEVCSRIPEEKLFEQSGIQSMNINTLFQLHYLVKHEKNTIFRAEKMLMMPDLFAYFLTGECRSEFTEATTTQLIDQKARGWNLQLIEAIGIPKPHGSGAGIRLRLPRHRIGGDGSSHGGGAFRLPQLRNLDSFRHGASPTAGFRKSAEDGTHQRGRKQRHHYPAQEHHGTVAYPGNAPLV